MAKELGFGEGYDAGRLGIIKAVHTAEVVATIRERNRIIRLLEEKFDDSCLWRQIRWSPDTYEGFDKEEIIALIKKEIK